MVYFLMGVRSFAGSASRLRALRYTERPKYRTPARLSAFFSIGMPCLPRLRPLHRWSCSRPAGGWEQLEYAIHFGADAVYLASTRYGMRRRADNFSEDELPRVVEYAHAHGVDVHVTVNTMMTDEDIDDLHRYFAVLQDAGVDAVIVGDMGALAVAREAAPDVAIHLSTQASCMNAASARVYASLGVSRIVLAREMSLKAIAEMRHRLPEEIELEAFVHGAMCMAYSGRCLISDYMAGRGANVGHCAQPCRWKYALVEEKRPGQYFPIEQDERGSFIMSSNDMNMLSHLQDLADAGVNSIKVEGRAKGAYYVASVVNAYRHVRTAAAPRPGRTSSKPRAIARTAPASTTATPARTRERWNTPAPIRWWRACWAARLMGWARPRRSVLMPPTMRRAIPNAWRCCAATASSKGKNSK